MPKVYVWGDHTLDVFTSVDALAGYAEYVDVENGLYERLFAEDGTPVSIQTAPFDRAGVSRWRRALGCLPERSVLVRLREDVPADPEALSQLLIHAIREVEPFDGAADLLHLRSEAERVWGITR